MPLQGHPRKDESFEMREKIPQAREECSGSRAGLAKGSGKRLRLHPLKVGAGTNIADRKKDPNSKQLNHL